MKALVELVVQPPFGIDATALDRLAPVREAFPSRAARRVPQTPVEHWFDRYGVARQPDWPAAAYRVDDDSPAARWLCADPVGLVVEGAEVVVNAHAGADLTAAEAAAYVDLLNAHFEPDGLHFVARTPSRWLLRLDSEPAVETTPAPLAHRRALMAVTPRGADAARLTRIATEAQMLFHECAPNQARAQRGTLPLGGVWLWGAGRRRGTQPVAAGSTLLTREPHLRGLAEAAGASVEEPPVAANSLAIGTGKAVVDLCDSPLEGEDWLAWFERDWLAPLAAAADRSEVHVTLLLPDMTVSTRLLPRPWRLPFGARGLAAWLAKTARH